MTHAHDEDENELASMTATSLPAAKGVTDEMVYAPHVVDALRAASDAVTKSEAEATQLRAALQEIADYSPGSTVQPVRIARKALASLSPLPAPGEGEPTLLERERAALDVCQRELIELRNRVLIDAEIAKFNTAHKAVPSMRDVLAAHAQFGGDLEDMLRRAEETRSEAEWTAFQAWWKSSGHAADPTFTLTMENCAHAAWQARALSTPAVGELAVKALEWRDLRGHSFPDMWCATSPCGVYDIEERSASDSPAYVALGPHYAFIADKDSLDEAKAACQADYEARIRSALASPKQGEKA
ncbi:hypothetical protein FJ973_29840 [Mesorhizobium sp. B2-1-3]|uniref:hypothetical protein n=1 Tax=Mesorhizobium sp. B2-1-3 TaxID=2589972 RepID=UPI0011274BBF|nr:hypothetical protein [Mesorhizobium sp. B2-1-3]TPN03846.1 hypothetical protein FJ973_29840 [Mesorhizobium sp. B2-1-3]